MGHEELLELFPDDESLKPKKLKPKAPK